MCSAAHIIISYFTPQGRLKFASFITLTFLLSSQSTHYGTHVFNLTETPLPKTLCNIPYVDQAKVIPTRTNFARLVIPTRTNFARLVISTRTDLKVKVYIHLQ